MRWDRYIAIIGRITQKPKVWNQGRYHSHCGTAHCVAGHAQIDAGKRMRWLNAWEVGMTWLDIDDRQAQHVFDACRTLDELQHLAITQKFPWEGRS